MRNDKELVVEFDNKDLIAIIEKKPRGYETQVASTEYSIIITWEKLSDRFKPLVEQGWGVDSHNYTYLITFHRDKKSPPLKIKDIF